MWPTRGTPVILKRPTLICALHFQRFCDVAFFKSRPKCARIVNNVQFDHPDGQDREMVERLLPSPSYGRYTKAF